LNLLSRDRVVLNRDLKLFAIRHGNREQIVLKHFAEAPRAPLRVSNC